MNSVQFSILLITYLIGLVVNYVAMDEHEELTRVLVCSFLWPVVIVLLITESIMED